MSALLKQTLSVTFSKENVVLGFFLNGAELFFKSVGLVAFFISGASSYILDYGLQGPEMCWQEEKGCWRY